jgi:starvation-inducible DNA-binding protein
MSTMTILDRNVELGIDENDRGVIAEGSARLLADTYTLYLKTHNYHWSVTGPMFQTLHLMFEQQYTELVLAVDLIAERIRALGAVAPGSYREFAAPATVTEDEYAPTPPR